MTPRIPNPKIVDDATGRPTQGFIGRENDQFTCRVQFFGELPEGGANYQWDVDPNWAVEWTDERFDWKRSFRVVEDGRIYCVLTDHNGFTYDVPSIYVRPSLPTDDKLESV